MTYFPLDILKFIIRYSLSGKAWDNMLQNKVFILSQISYFSLAYIFTHLILIFFVFFYWLITQTAFTTKKDYGKGEREAQWAIAQRTLHGLNPPETLFHDKSSTEELSEIAEQAKRRAEVAR